ncbi:MAG: YihA family ribosome biogenesis GTP-binding protein [Bacteroidetes bacterium]|nr:MAG: YihA family ribosome biogenesis GTP-binding protein [Bacteroidota bacterium]PIE88164.1 MAG: YihA family ribosome biogenesis GTP-binding protein [Bacteroidota bacterium]
MKVHTARFLCSSPSIDKCPNPSLPEYALIGRSNVGKSSFLNMLTGHKGLAKISGKPGKTRLINHFLLNDNFYMADLPGYGFAKVSKKEVAKWDSMIRNYILKRTNLMTLFLLVDSRLEPQKNDLSFMEWLAISRIPFVILFTKIDKLRKNQLPANIAFYQKTLLQSWEEMPLHIATSSLTTSGKEEVLSYIAETNTLFYDSPCDTL